MKLLFTYLKKYRGYVLLALLLAAVNQVFSLFDPLIFRMTIDNVVTKSKELSSTQFFSQIMMYLGMSVGAAFVSRVAKNFQDYFINYVVQNVGAEMYSDGLEHSLKMPYSVFEDQRSGETLSILQKARTDVERVVSAGINILFATLVGVLFVTVYAFTVHWAVVLIYFSTVPLIGWVSNKLSKKIKVMQKKIVGETTSLSGSTTESLRNIELVKSLGLAQQEINRLNSVTKKILGLELQKVRYIRSLSFIQGTMVNALRTSVMFLMFWLVFSNEISLGAMFSLFMYSFFIFGPLQEIGNVINIYREAEISFANLKRIFEQKIEVKPDNPVLLEHITSLSLENVIFAHQTGNHNALEDISVSVNKGETVAFVGPSGSGKTTLVKLFVGLYTPTSGSLKYNGIDSTLIDVDTLRKRMSIVTQETQLFAGTIRDNLLFVRPDATDEECMDVLKKSACTSLLERAEHGLDSVIGEGGVKVSGGERQRLSIARALLRKPDVMLFDEATSALDSLTEEEISATIRSVSSEAHSMTVLIAHRLSTIMHADRIYVLEKGVIIEQGTHDSLLDEKGLYYAMWRQQIGERK
jgi:ATP-binding cassette, subfamily B, bacterial